MGTTIDKYLKGCHKCQLHKHDYKKAIGEMSLGRVPIIKFEVWALDCMGLYTRSDKRHRAVLVMTEQSTKYCIIAPLLTKNAEKVIDKLETHLFQYFGYPKRIYTDNGTEFSNLKNDSSCEKYGIEQRFTPLYHAQANFVERTNRDIKTHLSMFCESNQKKWDEHIHHIQLFHNAMKNASTNQSPYYLVHGCEPRLPNDFKHDFNSEDCEVQLIKGNTDKIINENRIAKETFEVCQKLSP